MIKPLTIAFITSRTEPQFDWFVESLERRVFESKTPWSQLRVIVVDALRSDRNEFVKTKAASTLHVAPKPCVWSGPQRLTKENWWAVASAKNTALCLASTEWIAFLDDRSVIEPGYFEAIELAQKENRIAVGCYEKRRDVTVAAGIIRHGGTIIGEDGRVKWQKEIGAPNPMPCTGEWCFGANFAMPLDWALEVNGIDETCDGLGAEDSIFGLHLNNAGKKFGFDHRMKIIEDRSEGHCGPVMLKKDKGVSPNDKSHAILEKLGKLKRAAHGFDIREMRKSVLSGFGFQKPWGPKEDWWDGEKLEDMK